MLDTLFKSLLPKTLLKRAVLIIVLPLVLVQITSIYVFLDRHLDTVTRNIATNIASSIDLIAHLHKKSSPAIETAAGKLGFNIRHHSKKTFKTIVPSSYKAWEDKFLLKALQNSLKDPYKLHSSENFLTVYVLIKDETLAFKFGRKRLMSRTTPLVVFWAIGASIFFLIIAIIFMRNQVRPIKQLAEASERFGKGLDITYFKPYGASEVRQAAIAFRRMQERIKRQVAQRTEMLAGISHDLRTPLTRMKLDLAMLPKEVETNSLKQDIAHMESMIHEYLDFVKGDSLESPKEFDLATLIKQATLQWTSEGFQLDTSMPESLMMTGRYQGLLRAVDNLLSNARRFATHGWITVQDMPQDIHIIIDDNGPGIPENHHQDVLKPFFRLDPSRNESTGGIGLGLSIVADIVHNHGGNLYLGSSPQGGLRATIILPK
jgi:two-component system osmolarity sensor histidine kinase EnvZ